MCISKTLFYLLWCVFLERVLIGGKEAMGKGCLFSYTTFSVRGIWSQYETDLPPVSGDTCAD